MAGDGFVRRAFEALLKECGGNRKYSVLQSAIMVFLESGKDFNQHLDIGETNAPEYESRAEKEEMESSSLSTNSGGSIAEAEAELALNPLRLAFQIKNIKVGELALDCLQKLIEYNHLEGDPGLEGGKNSQALSEILIMVCTYTDNSAPDSIILPTLKVLLTAVASDKLRVHNEPLLGIVRACSTVALNRKNPIIQASSKAMLIQVLQIIFRRLETDLVSSTSFVPKEAHSDDGSNSMIEASTEDHNEPCSTLDNLVFVKQRCKTFYAASEGTKTLVGGADIKDLEAILRKAVNLEDEEADLRKNGPEGMSVEQHDALRVFHMLCKVGMITGNDAVTVKMQSLLLEVLQVLLEDIGHLFAENIQFIDSMRAHLSYALLRASVSQSPILFQYGSGIFSVILLHFRQSFKAEIGFLFPLIVLRSLDGSDLIRKQSVLRVMEKVFKDPQALIDLYINYDCDPEAPKLYDRMVATLSKLAQATQNVDPKSSNASLTASIKMSSLEGLVNILKSLGIWEKYTRKSKSKLNRRESFEGEVSPRQFTESKYREDSPDDVGRLQAEKITIEAVISEFNRHPGKGIQYLISSQLVENSPASVAQFLQNTPNLDKAMIGEYLGQPEEFPTAVMNAYVDFLSFSGMRFDIAMHEFFKGFQPLAEALKFDRIIEKFTARYCEENPGLFKNADAAYVLAYAIIMLNADAHNPMMQPKMSKSGFININATGDDEESAPRELIEEIYDSVVKEAITLDCIANGSNLINILNLSLPKTSSSTGVRSESESEAMIKQIQALVKAEGGNKGVFYTSHSIELLCPMVEPVGWSLLAMSAVIMSEVDNVPRFTICMEGFKEAIHITNDLGMDTMRYAFLTSLLRYNSLHAPKDMRGKNVEALRALLALCNADICALQGSWLAVLECISRLEYFVSHPVMNAMVMQGSNQVARDVVLQSLRELSGRPTEQLFLNSIKLPSESVVEFFAALCSVSAEELKQNPPRTFSLRKIVEVSYYNMARIRMVWARIWTILVQHFVFAGSHADENVAFFSIDSLQKLVMKYLERDEPANFTFQNGVLKPLVILQRSNRKTIRRLILDSSIQIVRSMAGCIRSGWHSVFMIFSNAAADKVEPIVELAFENVEQVILEHFDRFMGHCFMDCVNCLMDFANNKASRGVSLKAVALLHICADRFAESLVQGGPLKHNSDEASGVAEQYWFPMLAGLSGLTSNRSSEIRNSAIEVLFDLMSRRGSTFSPSFWEKIFRQILFPIFDCVRHAQNESYTYPGDEWPRESYIHALKLLCNLFGNFYKEVSFMLSPLLGLLLDCSKKSDKVVVSVSLTALAHLIEVVGHQFDDDDWNTLLKTIRDASYTNQPHELLTEMEFENKKKSDAASSKNSVDENVLHSDQTITHTEESEGTQSPSRTATRTADGESLQRSKTLGQMFYGNAKKDQFARSFTMKEDDLAYDAMATHSPEFVDSNKDLETIGEDGSLIQRTIRAKCMAQLLLLGVINRTQKQFWSKLSPENRITMMEILFSVLEFAASYNSYANLTLRMQRIPGERPPLNLLRLELLGTCIYLDILQKTTAAENDKFEGLAEEKLVSFCEHVLREAAAFQSSVREMTDTSVHQVLELRSPIIAKVLKGMCQMKPEVFKNHITNFYPFIAKLVCCQQMEIRGALGELFTMQLGRLLM
ncbi:brefeldin A-inhibited guanine nucleotide-exchange protein 5-like isoform X2 [Andrographis paniculata]|uniref:brefeldin A-inhibited guanine nucleotide-exchange protein 5-like isoform X2 n=1 Tax=Andrographis paniculata TaxID=175694 RepID=UPI0021E89455|nr:brefeldin A-inhibited guanine nucleotide-exchange protein 5-like isoform X2 [Andrographis paniculata]